MTLSWNNPLVKLVGRIRVAQGRSCIWCNERFVMERRLDGSDTIFCSDECARAFKFTRRVALGLRKPPPAKSSGTAGLPGLSELGKLVDQHGTVGVVGKNVQPRKGKNLKLVSARAAGRYSEDPLAIRYGIPRLSFDIRMPVGYDCHYCGKVRGGVTRDHIVPDSRGGSNAWFNLVPACQSCQNKKADGVGDCTCLYCLRSRKLHEEAAKAHKILR